MNDHSIEHRRFTAGTSAVIALGWREVVRFLRQPSRIIGTLGTGLVVWLVLASGFAGSFAAPGDAPAAPGYGGFLTPGMAGLVVMFASVFGAISLIEDRQSGFLRGVLAGPTPGWSLAASKLLPGALLATAQGAIILLGASVFLGVPLAHTLLAIAPLAFIAAGVTGLALGLAWVVNSVQGFHGVMNAVIMPVWLLSGSVFPAEGAAGWLRAIMLANPMTWANRALRAALDSGSFDLIGLSVAAVWAAAGFVVAAWVMSRRR